MLVFYWLLNACILLNVCATKDYACSLIMLAKQTKFVSKWYDQFVLS